MKASLAHVRAKGIPTLIGAALFIVVIMGGNLYKDYRQDQENARLLARIEFLEERIKSLEAAASK